MQKTEGKLAISFSILEEGDALAFDAVVDLRMGEGGIQEAFHPRPPPFNSKPPPAL